MAVNRSRTDVRGQGLLLALLFACLLRTAHSIASPKSDWKQAALRVLPNSNEPNGAWWSASGTPATEVEPLGEWCDPGADRTEDLGEGCIAVWVADKGDPFSTPDLPADQQNGFLNTMYYNKAWVFSTDGMGFRAGSLPIPGADFDPVCYVGTLADGNGGTSTVLGYEEPNGDSLLPCPGATEGLRFSEEQIEGPSDEELKVMCDACYAAVCSGRGSKNPRLCGGVGEGGVTVGDGADQLQISSQVSSAYHCHLTMADDGACNQVHYNQHVQDRNYLMESGVLCGWRRVRELQITSCDCTRKAGRNNGCGRSECLEMALEGVVCGNCGGCNQERAYEGIFDFTGMPDPYEGSCGHAMKLKDAGVDVNSAEYIEARRMCSAGLFCRPGSKITNGGCSFYCSEFGDLDTRCPARRRQMLTADEDQGDETAGTTDVLSARSRSISARKAGFM